MAREARVSCDSSSHARDECRKILELAVELPVLESPVIHLLCVISDSVWKMTECLSDSCMCM